MTKDKGQMTNDKEIVRLKEKVKKLEEENKKLKKLIQAVKNFVAGSAAYAQRQMLAGGLPTGQYHRCEGHIELGNGVAAIIGAEQTAIIKKRRLLGWGL